MVLLGHHLSLPVVSDVGILSEEHFQFNFNLKGLEETMQLGNVWQVSTAVVRGTAFQWVEPEYESKGIETRKPLEEDSEGWTQPREF